MRERREESAVEQQEARSEERGEESDQGPRLLG